MVTQARALGSGPGLDRLRRGWGRAQWGGGGGKSPLKSPAGAPDWETSRCSERTSSPLSLTAAAPSIYSASFPDLRT